MSCIHVFRYFVDALPNIPIHGCTTCHGIMTETGFHSGPVIGVLIIYDSGINAYGTGIEHFGDSIDASTFNAIDKALKNANREGEIPDLILLHSTPGNEEKVMAAIDKKFGTEVPISVAVLQTIRFLEIGVSLPKSHSQLMASH